MLASAELLVLEDRLAILSRPTGVAAYDFDFGLHFVCRHPYRLDAEIDGILRLGAPAEYATTHADALATGVRAINDPDQHLLASEIERWYPLIADSTPRTRVFDTLPDVDLVDAEFGGPVFLKGSRPTSRHNPALAVIRGSAASDAG